MKEVRIRSKLIDTIFFDQNDGKLWVRMTDGHVRLFAGVPASVVSEMIASSSPGTFYVERIRKNYQRLEA